MRINVAIPEAHVTAPVLNAALEGVTRLNEQLIKSGSVPRFSKALQMGLRWKPEPPGDEHFDHAGTIVSRLWGDCDDISPFYTADLRASGEDPGAVAIVKKSGPKRWHVVTRRSDGRIEDANLAAGMPGPARVVGVHGAVLPVMFAEPHGVSGSYIARPQLALRPFQNRQGEIEAWQARADLPWHWQPSGRSPVDIAMTALHRSPVSSQSIVGACRGAVRLGEAAASADPDHMDRLSAIADACEGVGWEDLADEYGPEHATAAGAFVGSFFGRAMRKMGKIARPLGRMALPLVTKGLNFVPGVGPVASMALQTASPMLQRALAERRHEPPHIRQIPEPPPGYPYPTPGGFGEQGGGFGYPPGGGYPQPSFAPQYPPQGGYPPQQYGPPPGYGPAPGWYAPPGYAEPFR